VLKGCVLLCRVTFTLASLIHPALQSGEEWFYMVKGDMVLKVQQPPPLPLPPAAAVNTPPPPPKVFVDGSVQDIAIKQGEMFMLPAHVPHSPQVH